MKKLATVRETMDRFVDTLGPDWDVMDAIDFLLEKRVTGAPVVDARGKLVGMLTETDCLRIVATGKDGDEPHGKVADYMTTDVQTIPANMDVYFAAGLFLNARFRRFPVVDDGRLVGVVTRFDILRAVQRGLRS
ncbi:MAG: CBS domain-containing protein [Deltaproteobacteria bacterium]|nr:CBS domain-containing protein [Deltaproteobacteria bacterium]